MSLSVYVPPLKLHSATKTTTNLHGISDSAILSIGKITFRRRIKKHTVSFYFNVQRQEV